MPYDYKSPRSEWHRLAGLAIRKARIAAALAQYDLPGPASTIAHLEFGRVLDRRPYIRAAEFLGIVGDELAPEPEPSDG